MSKIKNGWLDQYGAGSFEQQQFGTAGVERVKAAAGENDDRCGRRQRNRITAAYTTLTRNAPSSKKAAM